MKFNLLTIVFFCLFQVNSIAQKQNNIWFFGTNAGVNFNSGTPVALNNSPFQQTEGTACISDLNGNFLFYTDGLKVWNKNFNLMPNGTGLRGHSSSTQSALIVPMPGDCNLYYIFTVPAEDTMTPLCYSIVDMRMDSGRGDISAKNIPLYSPVTERLCATLKANNKDYWIVVKGFGQKTFLSFSLTSTGLDPIPVTSSVGTQSTSIHDALGYMKISPDHSKLCYATLYGNGATELFNFNNTTGIVSDALSLPAFAGYGVEFSPDNSKLYISTLNAPFQITQYNLNAGSPTQIQNSGILVYTTSLTTPQYGGALQLGPDNKIYVSRLQKNFLGCINNPNQPGVTCNYTDSAVNLGINKCQDGLPNFIVKYSPKQDSICQTQPSDTSASSCEITNITKIYPNPFTSILIINKNITTCKVRLNVYNAIGQTLLQNIALNDGPNIINFEKFASGVYFYKLFSGNEVLKTGKVVHLK